MRHQPADKSQINRRPCFLSPTLGTDTTKYHLPKRDRLTCLGLDITDIRARLIRCDAGWRASRAGGAPRARASEAFCFAAGSGLWGGRWRLSGTGYRGDSGPIVYGPVGINAPP